MANPVDRPRSQWKTLTMNDTLTSGITKSEPHLPIVSRYQQWGDLNTHTYTSEITTRTLKISVTNADILLGEHIATFPLGLIKPLGGTVVLTTVNISGTTGTGEVGLGTTLANGTASTLGGTVAFGDIMDGTTIADLTTDGTDVFVKSNDPDLTGTKATHGVTRFDGSATAKKLHLNIGHGFDASEVFTFQAMIRVDWQWCGSGLATDMD